MSKGDTFKCTNLYVEAFVRYGATTLERQKKKSKYRNLVNVLSLMNRGLEAELSPIQRLIQNLHRPVDMRICFEAPIQLMQHMLLI
jgi:hypothetical protein